MRVLGVSTAVALVLAVALLPTARGAEPEGRKGGAGAVPGVLWHNNFALDTVDGTQLASPSGKPPRTLDPNKAARAIPDGSRYAIYDYDNRNERTTLTVKRTADGAVLHRRTYDGYMRDLKPSPREASQLLVRYSDDVGDPTVFLALDLSTGAKLETFAASTAAVDWLSDGRVVAVGNTGTLSAGLPGGARDTTGRIDLLGRSVRHIAVQPGGTRLLLGLMLVTGRNDVSGSDLWLTDLDGSDTVRFTNTNLSNIGVWSPDGQRIAFDVDTGTVCIGAQCSGTCEIWHAPAQATMLNPLPAAPGAAARFSVLNRQGDKRTLGCRLLRWTP